MVKSVNPQKKDQIFGFKGLVLFSRPHAPGATDHAALQVVARHGDPRSG
jgi:hypothetical protein